MLWWWKKLKKPEDRSELERVRGELSEKVTALDAHSKNLEQLMKNMLAERAKDAAR